MRGGDRRSGSLLSYVDIEKRVRPDHPLCTIKALADEALDGLSGNFAALHSKTGRPSVPPEQLLRAILLQAFYSIHSERQLMENIESDLLYRWFVGLRFDETAWDERVKRLLSSDQCSVDGAPIEAWASMKSFMPTDETGADPPADPSDGSSSGRNAEVDFHGERGDNAAHASRTDPNTRLHRKGRGRTAYLQDRL